MGGLKFILASTLVLASSNFFASGAPANEKELFLTPLIKSGELDQARAASEDNLKLSKIKTENEVKSYSGFLTIDEAKNSNLFFWFFPAQDNPEKAPVILWINELPGYTCLKGIFLETGPFYVAENNQLLSRNASWTKTHSMLYIDAPVGSGFSFADDESAYAKTPDDEGSELYEALQQFFTLYKEFQPNEFYLAGEVYAGKFIPYIIKKIDAENVKAALKINLKGALMGAPFLHLDQVRKDDFYYNLGLIDETEKVELSKLTDKMIELANAGKYGEAQDLGRSLNLGPDSTLANMTGFIDVRNAMFTKPPEEIARFSKFIDSKEVHEYLHTGLHKFVQVNTNVFHHFSKDAFQSHVEAVEEVLDKGYRLLIYVGQFDIFVTPDRLYQLVKTFKWKGSDDFTKAEKQIWRLDGEVAGYVKEAGNLVYATIRNAGNYAIMDEPEWTLDLAERFFYNKGY